MAAPTDPLGRSQPLIERWRLVVYGRPPGDQLLLSHSSSSPSNWISLSSRRSIAALEMCSMFGPEMPPDQDEGLPLRLNCAYSQGSTQPRFLLVRSPLAK